MEKSVIKDFTNNLYIEAMQSLKYEVLYFALFFAIHYDFEIEAFDVNDSIEKEDCLFKFFSWLYCKRRKRKTDLRAIREEAIAIKNRQTGNMDRYWIYAYEVLPMSDLNDEWKTMKQSKVSFLRQEYRF